MQRLAFYSLILVLLNVLVVFAGEDKPSNTTVTLHFKDDVKQDTSTRNGALSQNITVNVTEAVSTSNKNRSMVLVEHAFNETVNQNETSGPSPMGPEGRSLKNLSPGEEYLLSVTSWEDVADSSWESLPYLKTLIQKGGFDFDEDTYLDTKKKSTPEQLSTSDKMTNMMDFLLTMNKADADDRESTEVSEKPTGFLAKLAMDPMNFILAAVIPFSLLLAAVIPILTNQFMTGLYMPSVYTIATGERMDRSLNDFNSTEFFGPMIDSITSFGAKTFEDLSKEKPDEIKVRFVKEALEMISNFVNEKWMSLFSGSMPHHCVHGNCSSVHKVVSFL
ncbi:uncharacterized protein NPIL_166191 [Nephila pilipes]|uniref:Uncharacterized protein n=1 Tax=Nephila pilipes TaxID=299642 RepID=A0A8X6T3K3_NEPPI|nr:uncharacterized protein NPIL_166191 [Nephila pilipes]